MGRLNRFLAAAAMVVMTAGVAHAQLRSPAGLQTARLTRGSIQGSVSDERGGPLAGAMVSALGATTDLKLTDAQGRFAFNALPPGEYVLRIHMAGFASMRCEAIRIATSVPVVQRIQLHRLEELVGTSGVSPPLSTRPILTAGLELPQTDTSGDSGVDHPHSETAWRLRHLPRSVLKDKGEAGSSVADAGIDEPLPPAATSMFGRAFDGAASLASLFTAVPFTGEVNILTTSAFAPGQLFSGAFLPRGVAYVSIGAPAAGGAWVVKASMNQSDLASWILAGSYSSRPHGSHDYGFGVSYSTQRYPVSNPAPVVALPDGSRNVGELYASDRWTLSPALAVEYSGRFARYDYLLRRGLLSPRIGFIVTPMENTHVTASVAQRMVAPGAEEFLAPSIAGPWLPPERTFAPLAGESFHVERGRFLDLSVDHEFEGTYVIGIRRFYRGVGDQMITLFGLPVPGSPKSPSHYYVANAGGVDADGWAVTLSSAPAQRVRGSIDYSVTHAAWSSRGDMAMIGLWAPSAIRPDHEDIHDLTTSMQTEIPETATRFFVLYRIDGTFTHSPDISRPGGFAARFDVQINQGLPFMPFGNTKWEVLVGVRNLFRDPSDAGSIYDELLVVRPPKRVVGGVLVRF